MAKKKGNTTNAQPIWRLYFVFMVVFALLAVGLWKTWDLQVNNNDQLQYQGDVRTIRNEVIVAHRGNILDRNGDPLAISTPVLSIVMNPKVVLANLEQWPAIAAALEEAGIDPQVQRNRLDAYADKEFMYVRRRMPPGDANRILDRNFPGVFSQEEYRRFYPLGEVAAHVVGLTNADDAGQEGMELAYEEWLRATPGSRQVVKDLLGRVISEVSINEVAQPGNDLHLSLDARLQYLAYRTLKEAVTMRRAESGTAVILDVKTGEVLALVNQPSYNPNNRESIDAEGMRNLAIVDPLEPGSTAKPFTVTAALESGLFDTRSIIDTNPGYVRIDKSNVKYDPVNYGELTLEKILTKSSQVGAIHLAMAMGEEPMLDVFSRVGFGQVPGTTFPGEGFGMLPNHQRWSKTDIATMGYGYGFKVTPVQLAQAYLVFASGGYLKPLSLLKGEGETVHGTRVISQQVVDTLVPMMETVVSPEFGGTGVKANLPAYRVAGKTGTAWVYDVEAGGYDTSNYTALFAGFLPASDPEIVIVVTIFKPQGEEYGGGQVAAPVFGQIAEGAMRILNIAPDKLELEHFELSSDRAPVTTLGAR